MVHKSDLDYDEAFDDAYDEFTDKHELTDSQLDTILDDLDFRDQLFQRLDMKKRALELPVMPLFDASPLLRKWCAFLDEDWHSLV